IHSPPQRRTGIRQEQRNWLRERDRCRGRDCLQAALETRERSLTRQIEGVEFVLRAKLRKPGQCEETRIDQLGPRLTLVEGERPSGISVGYANGVWQF